MMWGEFPKFAYILDSNFVEACTNHHLPTGTDIVNKPQQSLLPLASGRGKRQPSKIEQCQTLTTPL